MDHRGLFKTKLTIRGGQDRRQHFKNKRALERDNMRNFGRDITMTIENTPTALREANEERNQFKIEFKKKYRDTVLSKQDKAAALIHWRPPFVSVVPVGKFMDAPTTTALAKRITKTHENIQKTLTAKKVFPEKSPETARRSKRNIKRLNLNTGSKNNQFSNYLKKNGREKTGFTFVHSTTSKIKNKRKTSVVLVNNFEVSDEDDLDGISPIEDASDEAQTPAVPVSPLVISAQNESKNEEEIIVLSSPSPQLCDQNETKKSLPNHYISPFVTISRGKNKRETVTRNSIGILNMLTGSNVDDTVEMKMNREAALKYENYLNDETTRLQELNQRWELYRSENMDLADCVEMIDGTVGQTKLLMSSKFLQFRKVIDNCRFQNGDYPVYPPDLGAFWDVVKLQIKNVDDRFIKLEKLKANDWKDDIVSTEVINKKKGGKKDKNKRKSVISSLKDFIESKRQEKLKEENDEQSASGRKTRQTFRRNVVSALAKKNTPPLKYINSPNVSHEDKLEINRELENLEINSPVVKSSKKREKSIRFVEPRKSSDSNVLESSFEGNKENQFVETFTPTNSKRTSRKYPDTPKLSVLNLMDTPQSKERRRSGRTPKSKLSFCDELNNCSMRDSPIRLNKRTAKRTRRITALINDE